MDEFFQRNVETAADLRTEIFTMLGRMDRKIMGFSGQYHNLCSRQKQDLADHERNGNLALKTLKDQYEQEKIRLVRKQNEEIRKFEEAIRSAEKRRRTATGWQRKITETGKSVTSSLLISRI